MPRPSGFIGSFNLTKKVWARDKHASVSPPGFTDVSFLQDQVSGTTTSTVLKNLEPDTEYTVTVVPVYPEMEGISMSENGKTCKFR